MLRKTAIITVFALPVLAIFFSAGLKVSAEETFPVDLFSLDSPDEEVDVNPWNIGIYASFYGSIKKKKYYGCIGNLLHPRDDYFVALPATSDTLDCLEGRLRVKIDDSHAAFRVIEIKPHGEEGPILEATVEDIGPWYCGDDPYWSTGTRPASEDGEDARGRKTNLAGIDLSYKLARVLGITGMGQVDWRFKMTDGEFVVIEKETEFR